MLLSFLNIGISNKCYNSIVESENDAQFYQFHMNSKFNVISLSMHKSNVETFKRERCQVPLIHFLSNVLLCQ